VLFRLLVTGLISGTLAGIVATLFHFAMVEPLIFQAEQFETRAVAGAKTHVHQDGQTHEHQAPAQESAQEPEGTMQRTALTLIANILIGVAFGLLLATALTLYGQPISLSEGLMWGAAGFLSFSFLPALGLPPEIPGAAAGELLDRQIWWLSTAAISVIGLAILAFGKKPLYWALGLVLLAAPHIVGAPHPPAGAIGSAPPELAAHFAASALFMAALMWVVLGLVAAYVTRRIDATADTSLDIEV